MLKSLVIHHVALIDHAELEFSEGLNVLTGETGSGKSVILDSIDFVLGAKADKSMVRAGERDCYVRAEFLTDDREIFRLLEEMDIEAEDSLIVSRRLTEDGRSTLKLNGCTVTAAMLRRVTSRLVDVHGQSEHFFLLKESNQLKLLDSIAGAPVSEKKNAVAEQLSKRKEILSELRLIGGDEGERSRRMDILRYQIDEIGRVSPKVGEDETLNALRTRYRSAEKILEGLNGAREELVADGGGTDAVRSARRSVASLEKYDSRCEELSERLDAAAAELDDIAGRLEEFIAELDVDEREVERVETRYDEIKALKKKYGGSVESALAFAQQAEEEYRLLENSGERYRELTDELQTTEKALFAACCALTDERKRAAESFTKRVTDELVTLNIPSARFEVQFDEESFDDVGKATAEGLGGVRFLFSANKGEPLKELGKIISGGEMSRFMLAVKAQLSTAGGIGTYLFDEIDAGIGGKTARVVAEKFAKIAKNVQLIAVTHLAQIAAFADTSLVIEKKEIGAKTVTTIREAAGRERLAELARLIGGESEHVLAHARDLIEEATAYKNSL